MQCSRNVTVQNRIISTFGNMARKNKGSIGKQLLILLVLSAATTLSMCPRCFLDFQSLWRHLVIGYLIWSVMWFGNSYITRNFENIYSWIKHPWQRLVLEIVSVAAFSTGAMFSLIWIFKIFLNINIAENSSRTIYLTVGISMAVLLVMLGKEFLFSWRALALQEEKMKNEVLTTKFELLKSQINPHFMFNSLNTLRSLIYQNQDVASKYVEQLSKVYRSVLTSGQQELISLQEELKMLESYIYLQSMRFENRFKVNLDIPKEFDQKMIAPMVLQLLLENAIKHNKITEEHPLVIDIYTSGELIVVKNIIARKEVLPGDNTEIGLQNIKARYELLTDIPITVENDGKTFIVKIPLLEIG